MKKNATITKEKFYQELRQKHSGTVREMIRSGILEEMGNEEIKNIFRSLMELRDKEILDLLAKKARYFPMEMLDVDIKNHNDRDFMTYALTKYGKKFQYKIPENASRLFEIACMAECRPMLLFLLGKGLAEGQYPRLVSGSDSLSEVLSEIKVSGLHPDTIVTFFVEAAVSPQNDKRIQKLIDLGFDITAVNSEGLNACEVLARGIENYSYGRDKKAQNEKRKDRQGLKTLQRFYFRELS